MKKIKVYLYLHIRLKFLSFLILVLKSYKYTEEKKHNNRCDEIKMAAFQLPSHLWLVCRLGKRKFEGKIFFRLMENIIRWPGLIQFNRWFDLLLSVQSLTWSPFLQFSFSSCLSSESSLQTVWEQWQIKKTKKNRRHLFSSFETSPSSESRKIKN